MWGSRLPGWWPAGPVSRSRARFPPPGEGHCFFDSVPRRRARGSHAPRVTYAGPPCPCHAPAVPLQCPCRARGAVYSARAWVRATLMPRAPCEAPARPRGGYSARAGVRATPIARGPRGARGGPRGARLCPARACVRYSPRVAVVGLVGLSWGWRLCPARDRVRYSSRACGFSWGSWWPSWPLTWPSWRASRSRAIHPRHARAWACATSNARACVSSSPRARDPCKLALDMRRNP